MGVEAKEKKVSPMADSIIMDKITEALASCLYSELLKTEDFSSFETLVSTDIRAIGAKILCKCIEQFDAQLCANLPQGWSLHERASLTILTLVGLVSFKRSIFIDEYGRRRALTDELLGIPARSRLSPCAFLWIAHHASELSYRKTAKEFYNLTSVSISHVAVMNVVHREGQLLKKSGAEFFCSGIPISQDRLYLESDGLWIHLQETTHRQKALPRFFYEQVRRTKSLELKMAALYAGKTKVAPGRNKRGGLCLTCLDGSVDQFWERVWKMLCSNYNIKDVEQISIGGDGAWWCGPERINDFAPANCKVEFSLDLFHLMQKNY